MFAMLKMNWDSQEHFFLQTLSLITSWTFSPSVCMEECCCTLYMGSGGQLGCCKKRQPFTPGLPGGNVQVIGVQHAKTNLHSHGRCEHPFFTCCQVVGESDGGVLKRGWFPLHESGHCMTLYQQRSGVLLWKGLADLIWFWEQSLLTPGWKLTH